MHDPLGLEKISPECRGARSAQRAGTVVTGLEDCAGADHVLKSASETLGSFLRKATTAQMSRSDNPATLKLGMPVILMPFLTTQNNSRGSRLGATSLRSGGSGLSPSE